MHRLQSTPVHACASSPNRRACWSAPVLVHCTPRRLVSLAALLPQCNSALRWDGHLKVPLSPFQLEAHAPGCRDSLPRRTRCKVQPFQAAHRLEFPSRLSFASREPVARCILDRQVVAGPARPAVKCGRARMRGTHLSVLHLDAQPRPVPR